MKKPTSRQTIEIDDDVYMKVRIQTNEFVQTNGRPLKLYQHFNNILAKAVGAPPLYGCVPRQEYVPKDIPKATPKVVKKSEEKTPPEENREPQFPIDLTGIHIGKTPLKGGSV